MWLLHDDKKPMWIVDNDNEPMWIDMKKGTYVDGYNDLIRNLRGLLIMIGSLCG